MSLDLGALIGRVILETVEFDRTYVRIVRQFSTLGTEAEKSAAGTASLDEALAAVGRSGTTAATGIGRTTKATGEESAAAKRAAMAERERAAAIARVAEVMKPLADATAREQAATLRDVAAQERLAAVRQGATTEAGRQATATARVASAQAASIASAERAAAAQRAASESTATGWLRARASLSGFVKTAGELGLLIGVIAAVKGGLDIVHEASSFQKSMLLVETQAGAAHSEIAGLSTAVLGMAGQVAAAPEDLATSLYHVYSVGLRGAKALDVVRVAAEGARVGNADLEETTNALTSTVASGIGGITSMSQAMGVLNSIVGAGDMKLSDLNDALGGGILAIARTYGVNITQVGAALAVFGDNNIRGADAATKLRMSIMDLAKPAAHADEVLSSINLTSADLQKSLTTHGLTGALDLLSQHMKQAGITGSQVGSFLVNAFTKRAGAGLSVLIEQMTRYHQKLDEVAQGGATFGSRWEATTKTMSFAWDSLRDRVKAAGITVANDMLPQLTAAGQWLGTELPTAASALAGVLGGPLTLAWHTLSTAIGVIGTVLGPVLSILNDIKGPLGDIATIALGVWVAFKVGAAIPGILDGIALRAMYMGDSFVAAKGRIIGALTATSLSADATASEIVLAGGVAAGGWQAMLGPLAAVGLGLGLLVTMFHSSSHASAEATAAAKAYTDALQEAGQGAGSAVRPTIIDAIVTQLNSNDVPAKIATLNGALRDLGKTGDFTGRQFVTGIEQGGPALDKLRAKLEAIVSAGSPRGSTTNTNYMTAAARAAFVVLQDLNAQYTGMTKAQAKEVSQLKAFGTVAEPIQQVATKLHLAGDAVTQYAGMLGLGVTKSGDLVDSTTTNIARIQQLASVMHGASASVADLAKAWQTFAGSQGSVADRAALMAATLKSANGDALSYAAAVNAGIVADHGLASSMASAAKQAVKGGESVRTFMSRIIDLQTGTIRYRNAAAAPLISSLQSMQTAAMGAAQAMYQHARQTMTSKVAADQAYQVYVNQTRGSLIDQRKQLGLTKGEATKLADQYFGMPKSVKTLIEAEGTNSVVGVLNRIGALLAKVFGVPWDVKPTVDPKGAYDSIKGIDDSWMQRASHISRLWPALNADGSRAAGQMASVHNQWVARASQIARLRPLLGVDVNGALSSLDAVIGRMQVIGRGVTGTVHVITPTGVVKVDANHAYGGTIAGAGGPKQDNIPIMASAGEEVIQNPYAAMWRPLLKRINSGKFHGYATGGTVGNAPANDPLVTRTLYGPVMGGIRGVAMMLRSQIPGAKAAMADLAKAVGEAFQLKGVEQQIDSIKAKLTAVTDYRNSVMQTVSSTFSSQQYGSVGDLLSGFGGATAGNKTVDAQIRKLTGEGVNKDYLSNLVSQGQFTTLATLAGAGRGQIAQVNRAVGAYDSSLYGVGRAATLQKFGSTVGGVQGQLDNLNADRAQLVGGIARLVSVVAKLTGQPVSVSIGQEQVASAVFRSHEFQGVLDELDHLLHYGGNG